MKAADISTVELLSLLTQPCTYQNLGWMVWELCERYPNVPEKVLRAKLSKLVRRGYIDGCTCGCRGEFVILEKGRQVLDCQ